MAAIRVILALLTAAATAASLFAVAALLSADTWPGFDAPEAPFFWGAAFTVSLAHAMVFGLPVFLILRWLHWTRWWTSLVCGFAIGCLPYAVIFFPASQGVSFSQVGSNVLTENGVVTAAGWRFYAETVGFLGMLGMAGGLAAWLVWYWLGRATLHRKATPGMR